MSSRKVFMNVELSAAIQWMKDRWETVGAVLRLFRNDFEPTPASVAADFLEANFQNYQTIIVGAGQLAGPTKAADGHYEMLSNQYTYVAPSSGAGNMIYGAYVTLDGIVICADRFPEPIPMQIGSAPFRLRVRVSTKSESLFELE